MKISWTPTAKASFLESLDYISKKWTHKEVWKFTEKTNKILRLISESPYIFIASSKKPGLRRAYISKQTSLYYRISPNKNEIQLIAFRENRMHPGIFKDF